MAVLNKEDRKSCRTTRKLLASVNKVDENSFRIFEKAISEIGKVEPLQIVYESISLAKYWNKKASEAIKERDRLIKISISVIDRELKLNANQ